MTPTKQRALIALADATDRPFLSAAPLMAIVEAVAVLDEAGLLASPDVGADVTREAVNSYRARAAAESGAAEEAIRRGIECVLEVDDYLEHDGVISSIRAVIDKIEVTTAAANLCEALDDAGKAKAVLDDEGFSGPNLEAQVRALVVAWSDERDEARRGRFARSVALESLFQLHDLASTINDEHLGQSSQGLQYLYAAQGGFDALGVGSYEGARAEHCQNATVAACSDCGAVDGDSHLSGCDRDDPAAPPMQARLIEPLAPVPCPKCGEPLNGGQTCLNFPACPNATIPF